MAQHSTISQDLINWLVTKNFDPKYKDASGNDSAAGDAVIFVFDYIGPSGKNYGTAVIVLADKNDLQLFFGDNLGKTMDNPEDKLSWFGKDKHPGFLPDLMKFAVSKRYTFTGKDISQLKHTMAGMAAIKEGLFEGYYGNRKISYMGEQTEARLVIKHNRILGENDARFRYVESLFIETADGERFKLPFTKLVGGRAMLEHVRQGGRPYDIRGNHICEMITEMNVLNRFNRASQRRVFEGVTQQLIETVQTYYAQLKESLQHLSSGRGYKTYFESWTPSDITDENALVEDLKTMFLEQTLDSRIESALPILAKIQQGTVMKEADIFENWINTVTEGTWQLPDTPESDKKLKELMAEPLIVGPDAVNAKQQLRDIIGDDQLDDILGGLAERDSRANAWEDTDVQARLAELGIQMTMPEPAPEPEAQPAQPPALEESTCNYTAEGQYCPEHGLMECGSMYEMGTVAGGMAPVMGEGNDDPMNYNAAITGAYYESKSDDALLARIKSLAMIK
jgi:hypothetical protein